MEEKNGTDSQKRGGSDSTLVFWEALDSVIASDTTVKKHCSPSLVIPCGLRLFKNANRFHTELINRGSESASL